MAELEDYAQNENQNHLYDALKRKPVAVPYLKQNIRGGRAIQFSLVKCMIEVDILT